MKRFETRIEVEQIAPPHGKGLKIGNSAEISRLFRLHLFTIGGTFLTS